MNRTQIGRRPITQPEADPFALVRWWEEITMRVPTGVWKAVTHLVAVVASFLLILVFTAVLPFGLGSVVLLGMIVAVGLVAGGVLEGPAVRLATRASAPTDGELQVLSTVPDPWSGRRVLVCRSDRESHSRLRS